MALLEDLREVVEELVKHGIIKTETRQNELLAKLHRSDEEEKPKTSRAKGEEK